MDHRPPYPGGEHGGDRNAAGGDRGGLHHQQPQLPRGGGGAPPPPHAVHAAAGLPLAASRSPPPPPHAMQQQRARANSGGPTANAAAAAAAGGPPPPAAAAYAGGMMQAYPSMAEAAARKSNLGDEKSVGGAPGGGVPAFIHGRGPPPKEQQPGAGIPSRAAATAGVAQAARFMGVAEQQQRVMAPGAGRAEQGRGGAPGGPLPAAGGGAQQPPQQQQQGQQSQASMRELRVEDALLYLDHVKMEFKDRPQIYNEFLAIMKNFKTQTVDTPGVIRHVSKLFRGYNNLILGFNTFLPDDYKISLADVQRQEAEEARAEAAAARGRDAAAAEHAASKAGAAGRMGGGQQQFGARPPVQPVAQEPGSSSESMLARAGKGAGPPPPPHQASAPTMQGRMSSPQQQGRGGGPAKSPGSGRRGSPPSAAAAPPPSGPGSVAKQPQQAGGAAAAAAQPQQHQAVEFDHAISYVTTIKRRFANDPSTYHSFLEILHTYQKEQRGIKEVLEQVAHLFQDHPDLLKEFTFFLPDAVQDQAKERLHRAAAESESRQARQRAAQMDRSRGGPAPAQGSPVPPATGGAGHQQFIDMTRSGAAAGTTNNSNQGSPGGAEGRRGAAGGAASLPISGQPQTTAEVTVYNSAVERQFFDAAREALSSYTRDGGQAWAEYLKCLDMYAQDILSRTEMLSFVEPLLGKRNTKLFEEFKKILAAAGSLATLPVPFMEDSWYSVPLSEIDFSRCRRCTPSYRALPRDYPAPPCSDRDEIEAANLNDIWVSLPVGSEESYTFRHMRRNTYEEQLFRVEDERFEIDMVIDSNASTLHRLQPIAEEIAQLAKEEMLLDLPEGSTSNKDGNSGGMGGRRFQYSFDKNCLGVINRNAIARLYGDAGQEMLELLVKNPTVAVPIVVSRMKQKDKEWRAVRVRLNLHWKELALHNYYKSLDHRSLTWRTTDKRATSTRTLVAELKDRAAHGGHEGQDALRQKMDKAKEEHGTFYEITMKDALSINLDLTFLPKPDRRLFTPHLSLMYENNSWAQRDAYRILAFALERGHTAPSDKERCHRLWTEFLGPLFGLSLNWMLGPAVAYQESTAAMTAIPASAPVAAAPVQSDDDESMAEEDMAAQALLAHKGNVITEEMGAGMPTGPTAEREFTDQHPLPSGAHISTVYGDGRVVKFRPADHIYEIRLEIGATAYLRPTMVLCSILPVEESAYTRQLRKSDSSKLTRPGDQLVIGTQSMYLFLRLHQILIRRLNIARRLASDVGSDRSLKTLVEQMPGEREPDGEVGKSFSHRQRAANRRYQSYLSLVYELLDGNVSGGSAEGGKYEDRVRGLLGHGAYELATMDKLISHIWKNIQSMAGDETMWNLVQLYRRHLDAGSFQPEAFRQEAAYHSEGEPMYGFQYCHIQGKDAAVMHMEYLGVMEDVDDVVGSGSGDVPMEEEEEEAEMHHHHHAEQQEKRKHHHDDAEAVELPSTKRQRR